MGTETTSSGVHPVESLAVRAIGTDEWADVRALHLASFARLAGPHFEPEVTAAFRELVVNPEYTSDLQRQELVGAWLHGHLVGTCGWLPADDNGVAARVTSLFVDPMFTRLGIGRRLLEAVEEMAREGGYRALSARAVGNSVPFFEAAGYEVTSRGVSAIAGGIDVHVAFMRKATPAPAEGRSGGAAPDAEALATTRGR